MVALARGLPCLSAPMSSRPHEAFFKSGFEQPGDAAALLREVLPPAVRDAVAWDSLAPDRGSFVDLGRPDRHNDLLFTARLRIGARGRVFVLLEHQSTDDAAMPQRILSYQVRIWDRFRKTHGRARRRAGRVQPPAALPPASPCSSATSPAAGPLHAPSRSCSIPPCGRSPASLR